MGSKLATALIVLTLCAACGHKAVELNGNASNSLIFNADSAYRYCVEQCAFGPRVMNTAAHDSCKIWIKNKFRDFGLLVETQNAEIKAFNGTMLQCSNIRARFNPEATQRILLCAHWDTRPWADNDRAVSNHTQPVMGANDGASGVGVMLEIARVLTQTDSLNIIPKSLGVDFLCFDAEDYGDEGDSDSWALGAQLWANGNDVDYKYAILLDMVGGEGARFYQEGMSCHYAPQVVERVWNAAKQAGYSALFPSSIGTYVTDDHIPVNQAGIPCVDIIGYYPDCPYGSFGPTWHTVEDTVENLSLTSLKGVGQTVLVVLEND